jgi:DNA-binding transcriptional LysR family regulator
MDRLGNIEAFVEAAELGSFTLAARRLGITPSALSRRIAQLEDEVGVRLLHRTTRRVRLSDEGRAYFDRSRSALRELREARETASGSRDRPVGLLRVEAPSILGRCVVVPALNRVVQRYPEVRVDLALRDHPSDMIADGIDVAIRLGDLPDSQLVARRIGRTRLVVCGASSYLRRRGTPKSLDALLRHERLGFSVHGRVLPWRLRDGSGVRELAPTSRVVANDAGALIDLAAAGAGLGWICDFMMRSAAGSLVEVLADSVCEEAAIHAVCLPTRHVLPKVRAFLELVARELGSRRARS